MAVKRKRGLKTTSIDKRRRQLKDRQTNNRDWAGLPDYLIEIVIEKLPLVDCLSFDSVCKLWRSITTKFFDGSSLGIPVLVKPGQSENLTRTCLSILDNKKKPSLDIPMPEYIGSHIWGSYRDWLFLGRLFKLQVQMTLLNPFSGERVVLPTTYDNFHMVVLSSVPSDPKCICMLVHGEHGVAFWTSGAQEWRKCVFMGCEGIADAIYHEGQFYLLTRKYEMVIIDGKSVLDMMMLNIDSGYSSRIVTQYIALKDPCLVISCDTRKYLVESNGDIVLVCRIFYEDSEETHSLETFRLDISQGVWVKLESLGDKVIMLGKACSRSFHAKEELGEDALANNIYFSNSSSTYGVNQWSRVCKYVNEPSDVDEWGVFSLNKESCDWPRAFREPGKHWPGIWVTAPIWWCFRQQTLNHY